MKVPYEKTLSGARGAAKGPKAITDMLDYQVEEWDYFIGASICHKVSVAGKELKVAHLSPQEMVKAVGRSAKDYFDMGKFLITLGGEHSVSLGAVSAARECSGDFTVLQIDAHADLRDDNSDYEDDSQKITKYAHSCVMRRIYELGLPIVQIGIRSFSSQEAQFIKKEKMEKNIFYAPVAEDYGKIISRCNTKKIYITIDVDGFDPAFMPATGTPEPGGLSWDWTLGLLRRLFLEKEIIGFDIVEVAPRETDYLTEFAAAKLLYHLIGLKFLR